MKTISMTLDTASIDAAIAELNRYRDEFLGKCRRLREMIAERIRWRAEAGFSFAMVNDMVDGSDGTVNDVTVDVTHEDNVSIVFTHGTQAVFIEFGAGVYHNGPVGQSPHPWGAQFGYTIGGYGKGHGKYDVWRIPGGGLTYGTPAEMPMYRGMQAAIQAIDEMVREVFGND